MSTDRELLELAARAAGMKIGPYVSAGGSLWDESDPSNHKLWNPLEDDGDAFRLAIRMAQMYGFYKFMRAWLVAMSTAEGDPADPCAATRRAITRAAAEIQRNRGEG